MLHKNKVKITKKKAKKTITDIKEDLATKG